MKFIIIVLIVFSIVKIISIIWVSKSEIKRDAEDLKQLGEKLVNLTKANLTKVPLDDSLKDAIELAQRLQKEARRRQLQYIGKLLRSIDAEPIREALEKIETMIPDYDNFLADVFQQFGDDYLANMELPD